MQELTIRDLLSMLRKWLALILTVPLAAGIAAGIYYSQYAKDEYTATTSMYVLIRYEDSTGNLRVDTTTSSFFASDYKELFKRSPVMEATRQEFGNDQLEKQVEVTVTSVPNSRIVEVSAKGRDPVLCANVANAASRIFKSYIEEFMKVDSVSITQEAKVPTKPSGPARMRNTALAFLVGLALAVGVALAVEMFNTRITSDRQVEDMLRQPLLGSIVDYPKELTAFMEKDRDKTNYLYRYVSQPVRESVKAVAMNIGFASVDHPVQCIAVTSATPDEGKSSFVTLLSAAFAEEGKLVLVVDADFRRPTLGRLLKRRNRRDLMDYLAGAATLEEVATPTAHKNIFFIDSCHSAALLSRAVKSDSFGAFLETVKKTFDLVIFDTPPLGVFIDAAVLAQRLDGAVMVIANNRVEMKLAEDVIDQLKVSGAATLGIVLNFVKQAGHGGYYYGKKYGMRENGNGRAIRNDYKTNVVGHRRKKPEVEAID